MAKKKNDVDFFNFMHYTIWPKIEKYIENNAEDLDEEWTSGEAGLIMAYGWGGMANWGSKKGLKRRIKNIMLGSLNKGICSENELKELCAEAIVENRQQEISDDD